jgi:MIP family channel proteins
MSDFNVWRALLTEFLGTFTLVLIGAGAVALTAAQGGSLVGSAFAFGLVLMSLFYAWGSFSGAHFNPAVSFGFAVAGRMHWGLMLGYWIAQFLGGIAAGALVAYFYGTASGAGASIGSLTNTDAWKAFLVEAFLTFFLVITVLLVTRNPLLAVASGLAIGLVLTFNMLAAAPLTGASMNPARSLGPAIFSNNMGSYWIYIVGPLVGALVAALVYKLFTTDFSCCDKLDECGNPVTDECGNCLKECQRPVIDNCGRPVLDCDGCPVMETYTKRERKPGFIQENFMSAIGQWMNSHGFNPMYIKQEFDRAVQKAIPDGVVQDPQAVVKSGVERVVPTMQGRASELMSTGSMTPDVSSMVGQSLSSVQPMERFGASAMQGLGAPVALSSLAPSY